MDEFKAALGMADEAAQAVTDAISAARAVVAAKNLKIRKFAQPKMAVALVGDIPSFIPPGKIPFITHMWKQATKVPMIPQQQF